MRVFKHSQKEGTQKQETRARLSLCSQRSISRSNGFFAQCRPGSGRCRSCLLFFDPGHDAERLPGRRCGSRGSEGEGKNRPRESREAREKKGAHTPAQASLFAHLFSPLLSFSLLFFPQLKKSFFFKARPPSSATCCRTRATSGSAASSTTSPTSTSTPSSSATTGRGRGTTIMPKTVPAAKAKKAKEEIKTAKATTTRRPTSRTRSSSPTAARAARSRTSCSGRSSSCWASQTPRGRRTTGE